MADLTRLAKRLVVEHLGVGEDEVVDSASFVDDLGIDSLDATELVMAFEEEFGLEIPPEVARSVHTFGDAVRLLRERA